MGRITTPEEYRLVDYYCRNCGYIRLREKWVYGTDVRRVPCPQCGQKKLKIIWQKYVLKMGRW